MGIYLMCLVSGRKAALTKSISAIGEHLGYPHSFDSPNTRSRKMRGGRMSGEDIVIKHRDSDESISPTSHPSGDFHDPWEHGTSASRRTGPLDDDDELLGTARSFSRNRKAAPIMHDLEDDIEIESTPTEIRAAQ